MTNRQVICVCAALLSQTACSAASATEAEQGRFEVTPFIGLRAGGDFDLDDDTRNVSVKGDASGALALSLRIDQLSQYELFYTRQATRLEHDLLADPHITVEYLHLGGTVAMEGSRKVIPYGLGGLGVTRFAADAPAASDDARFSLSLGAGIRMPIRERFSLKLEGRGYLTLVDSDTAFFCRSDEEGALCRIRGKGSTFFQYELLAGAAFSF